jgi:hypothetical protein
VQEGSTVQTRFREQKDQGDKLPLLTNIFS